jgi:hypothetical protein
MSLIDVILYSNKFSNYCTLKVCQVKNIREIQIEIAYETKKP